MCIPCCHSSGIPSYLKTHLFHPCLGFLHLSEAGVILPGLTGPVSSKFPLWLLAKGFLQTAVISALNYVGKRSALSSPQGRVSSYFREKEMRFLLQECQGQLSLQLPVPSLRGSGKLSEHRSSQNQVSQSLVLSDSCSGGEGDEVQLWRMVIACHQCPYVLIV